MLAVHACTQREFLEITIASHTQKSGLIIFKQIFYTDHEN
jgi:hypothetical protein